MPFFRYSATDKSGAPTSGTVEAATPDDAMLKLVNSGLSVSQLMKATGGGQPPVQPQRIQEPPARTAAPQPQPVKPTPATTTSPSWSIIRTKPGTDKDLMLVFSQLAKQLKAGIGPAEAFNDLKLRVPRHMSESMEEASRAATNGKPISDTLERYPDLYPENVVGMLRSAEAGGFLEEACELLADQSQNAHAFGRMFWWVRPMVLNAIISLPLAFLFLQALVKAWDVVDKQGEGATMTSSLAALGLSVLKQILWPIGPITLVLWGGAYWLYRHMRTDKMRLKRHEIALRWPAFGARTKHECLAVFSWVMSKLSKSGIAPKKSWELAAASVPNLAVKDRLVRIGNALGRQEKLSDAVFREGLFPQEYAPIIATAEHTGDMPGAFEQLAKISKSEFETAQTEARLKSGGWGRAGCFLVGGILMILLCWVMYYELMPAILSGLE